MATSDPELLGILARLPAAHRRHLVRVNKCPTRRTVEEQIMWLANNLDAAQINSYRGLYESHSAGSFAWYRFDDSPMSSADFVRRIMERFPEATSALGRNPDLRVFAPPELHRIVTTSYSTTLEYGAKDSTRSVLRNLHPEEEVVEHLYIVVVRDNPFTVQVRAGSAPKQEQLLEGLQRDADIELGPPVECVVVGLTRTDALQRGVRGRFVRVAFLTTTGGTKSIAFDADEATDLKKSPRYRAEKKEGSVETVRGYEFATAHASDGYQEKVVFEVTVKTGAMRFRGRPSELAIENLRSRVSAMFD